MSEMGTHTKNTNRSDETLAVTAECEAGGSAVDCSSPVLLSTSCNNHFQGSTSEPYKKLQHINSVSDGGGFPDNSPGVLPLNMPSISSASSFSRMQDHSQLTLPASASNVCQRVLVFQSQPIEVAAIRTLRLSCSSDRDKRSLKIASENQHPSESPSVSFFAEAAAVEGDSSTASQISNQTSGTPPCSLKQQSGYDHAGEEETWKSRNEGRPTLFLKIMRRLQFILLDSYTSSRAAYLMLLLVPNSFLQLDLTL
jgi:hypothetical protein